jgi:hypothetical protein
MTVKTDQKKQIIETQPEVMTGFKQTKGSWAKFIESYADVPEVFKPFFDPLEKAGRAMPHTVTTPTYEGYIQKTRQKLVCDLDNELYILTKQGDTYQTMVFPFKDVQLIEVNSVLLDTILTICGDTKFGGRATAYLRFNATSEPLFNPFIHKIRSSFSTEKQVEKSDQFLDLAKANYKLSSFARSSLLNGEKVYEIVLQPEIRKNLLKHLTPHIHRTVFPAHVYLLTQHEFILIRETDLQNRPDNYGGIWDYAQLSHIKTMSISECSDGLLKFTVALNDGPALETRFQPALRPQIEQMIDQFKALTAKA